MVKFESPSFPFLYFGFQTCAIFYFEKKECLDLMHCITRLIATFKQNYWFCSFLCSHRIQVNLFFNNKMPIWRGCGTFFSVGIHFIYNDDDDSWPFHCQTISATRLLLSIFFKVIDISPDSTKCVHTTVTNKVDGS